MQVPSYLLFFDFLLTSYKRWCIIKTESRGSAVGVEDLLWMNGCHIIWLDRYYEAEVYDFHPNLSEPKSVGSRRLTFFRCESFL